MQEEVVKPAKSLIMTAELAVALQELDSVVFHHDNPGAAGEINVYTIVAKAERVAVAFRNSRQMVVSKSWRVDNV